MSLLESVENELWVRYRRDNDAQARDRLFHRYAPWAKGIAHAVQRRVWSAPADTEDFVQNAHIGLLEAMSRYDPGRGIAFPNYAKPRVRGAVFNGLRAILGERPHAERDARFDSRLEHLDDAGERDAFATVVDSIIGLGIGYMLDEAVRAPVVGAAPDALAYAHRSEVQARLAAAVAQLPERLCALITAHYFEFIPFNEIATASGLTKGRISQLHKAALDKLRAMLREERG